MALTFQKLKVITKDNLKELTEVQKEQMIMAGGECFGQALEPDKVLEQTYDGNCDLWGVADESGKAVYDVWVINIDSGVVFEANTTKNVGVTMIQFGFDVMDDDSDEAEKLAEDLQTAFDARPKDV